MSPVIKAVELPTRVSLSYVEQGDGLGVPVLLLPGLGDSWRSFEPVLHHLPESIRAFALTQRGHGDASHPSEGYRFHDFAADVTAFMDALHLEAAVIAAHSASGFFAQRFAIDHPQRTLGLVFIGSPATIRVCSRRGTRPFPAESHVVGGEAVSAHVPRTPKGPPVVLT